MPAPVILIAGDDDLLLQRTVERLLDDVRGADPDVRIEVHDVAETTALPELRTASLFGGRTCVVLRGAEALSGDLAAEVEGYLAAPSDQAWLVLVARGTGRIPKLARLAAAAGERIDVKAPTDWDSRAWDRIVTAELSRLGRRADAAAVAALRAHAGNDTALIATKVAQVAAATPADRDIGAGDVTAVTEGHGRVGMFAIADAVADRDPAAALVALRGALEAGEAPLAVLGTIVFRLRQLLQVRSGASAADAGLSAAAHRRLQRIAAAFHPGELAWCHDRLAQLDVDLKSSDLPDDLLIELAVVEVATSTEVGAPFNPLAVG